MLQFIADMIGLIYSFNEHERLMRYSMRFNEHEVDDVLFFLCAFPWSLCLCRLPHADFLMLTFTPSIGDNEVDFSNTSGWWRTLRHLCVSVQPLFVPTGPHRFPPRVLFGSIQRRSSGRPIDILEVRWSFSDRGFRFFVWSACLLTLW